MQTLQSNNVGRLSDSLERRSPDKALRASKFVEFEDLKTSRSGSPTRSRAESPSPASRNSAQAENAPPSSMLALQTIRNRQESQALLADNTIGAPLADITNGVPLPPTQSTYSIEGLSSQILNITSIATNLQREMASLSKRSKDNATDLVSLKEATSTRDEDIRKSLKDLIAGLDFRDAAPASRLLSAPEASRSTPNLALYLDDKPHNTTPGRKNFNLPRIGSPSTFDRDLTASPSIACVDGAASIALLEKVLREMATKDGQDRIMETLESVRSQALVKTHSAPAAHMQTTIDPKMMSKLEDILSFMKKIQDESGGRALVRRPGQDNGRSMSHSDLFLESSSNVKGQDGPFPKLSSSVNDSTNSEVLKMMQSVKQSLSQGGGLTNEVKALVRELRGEVLGMGRDIAKKLEDTQAASPRSMDAVQQGPGREEIDQIVDEALGELKEHMHEIVRENRRQSVAPPQQPIDTQEIAEVVRSAIAEMPMPMPQEQPRSNPAADRDEILAAVKEAWEDCKPEVALEHYGLEREEILETLKEGMKSYQQPTARDAGASYEEVLDAVRKGMVDFKPPKVGVEETVTREEIFAAVREVLENFDWPVPSLAPSSLTGSELTRREVVEAVEEGMARQPPVSKEVEFNREDLFDAIKSCLEGEQNPLGGMGERVVEAMHEFLGSMKNEFQQYSAANGKDTEQVLDALKDGLEELRADIESYVNQGADVTGRDEILTTIREGLGTMRADMEQGFATRPNASTANTPELLDAMEKEFQHLRDTISKSMVRAEPESDKDDILDAIRDLADDRQSSLSSNSEDIVRLVKEELEHMRTTLAGTLIKSGASIQREDVVDAVREAMESKPSAPRGDGNESILSNTSELLDAFQDGVDNIRHDLQKLMDRPVDLTSSYEILDTLKSGIEDVRTDISHLQDKQSEASEAANPRDRAVVVHDENQITHEIESLKVMITQLRIKVEALDDLSPPQAPAPSEMRVHKDDLDELHTAIQGIHATVREVKHAPARESAIPSNVASKDDTDALETLLRNMKAKVDDLVSPDMQSTGKTVQMEAMEDMLRDVKATVEEMSSKSESSAQIDLELTELMLKDIQKTVDHLQSKFSGVASDEGVLSKAEIAIVESLCSDIKEQIDGLDLPDTETLPTKNEVIEIRDNIKAFREQLEADNELTAQAFEARKIEHGGLANKIDDVKNVIGDLRDELMGKLDGSEEGIVELNKVLGMHHDSMITYATATSINELSELVKAELGKQTELHVSNKTEMDDRSATLFNKHDETTSQLKTAIEWKFNELMVKYDDAQQSNSSTLNSFSDGHRANAETITSTKAVVEDLKGLMDTLGNTVTETCERMSDDSKTVFIKVDEASDKILDLQAATELEHGHTRDEVGKALAAAMRLEGTIAQNHPAILAAIREVMDTVGQHYQHSQHQTEEFARATEEIKTGVSSIPASIPPLLPAPTLVPEASPPLVREVPATKEYDDTQVHDKLNNLISHAAVAKEVYANLETHHKTTNESLASLEKLDKIHEQVVVAAAEISAMTATQSRLMAEHHDARNAEATEAAIALEKRTAQKEKVEADIVGLNQEKNALIESMAELRREQAELSLQTKRLTRDVGKLETALSIRQEEMRDMNVRAETLERRIFEGLMNHARTVKAATSKPMPRKRMTAQERDASMSLKRVPSTASASTITTKSSLKEPSSIGGAVGAVLKKRAPLTSAINGTVSSRASGVDRRILSTSVMSHRSSVKGGNDRALVLAPVPRNDGFISLKRSHSVKSNPSGYGDNRKQSWGGVVPISIDKENLGQADDQHDEVGNHGNHSEAEDDDVSDAGTERRTSILSSSGMTGTSYMYTDSLTYGTGSDLSTRSGRTTSYASSIGGTINGQNESIAEEDETEPQIQEDNHAMVLADVPPTSLEAGQDNSMSMTMSDWPETPAPVDETVVDAPEPEQHQPEDHEPQTPWETDSFDFAPPPLITNNGLKYDGSHLHGSDSGLGTEPPTAQDPPQGEAFEYFQMTEQDMRQRPDVST